LAEMRVVQLVDAMADPRVALLVDLMAVSTAERWVAPTVE